MIQNVRLDIIWVTRDQNVEADHGTRYGHRQRKEGEN